MEITTTNVDGAICLALAGRLNTNTSVELEAAILALPEGANGLIFDFEGLAYLSSAGLRVLVAAQKRMNASGGTLVIRNVREEIMEIFQMTGLDDVLAIE